MNKNKLTDKTEIKTSENNKTKKEHPVLRVLGVVKNVVCWTLIAVLAAVVIFALYSRINGNAPTVFGYSILRISSGSMEPELKIGDVILSKEVNSPTELNLGDVITYRGKGGEIDGKHVTHKIIVAPHENDLNQTVLQTQGIANDIADAEITFDQVESLMVCKLAFLDTLYNMFLSPWGLIIFILLILLIFFDEIVNIVKIASGNSEYDEPEDINAIIERLQAEEREKQLAEQQRIAEVDRLIAETDKDNPLPPKDDLFDNDDDFSDDNRPDENQPILKRKHKGGRHRKEN